MIELFAHSLCWNGGCCLFNCQFESWQFDLDYLVTAYTCLTNIIAFKMTDLIAVIL
jgi:hypothetical protein